MPILRRRVQAPTPDIADIAGLMGPVAAGMGVLGKMTKLSPEDLGRLGDLLGRPLKLGRNLVRISSLNPQKNQVILHDATRGDRITTTMDEFWKTFQKIGEPSADIFPEGSVMSRPGERIPEVAQSFGPRGGPKLVPRKIPKTATR